MIHFSSSCGLKNKNKPRNHNDTYKLRKELIGNLQYTMTRNKRGLLSIACTTF